MDSIIIPAYPPNRSSFNRFFPSISSDNDLIPIHSIGAAEILPGVNNSSLYYHLTLPKLGSYYSTSRITTFCQGLSAGIDYRQYPSWTFLNHANIQGYCCSMGSLIHYESLNTNEDAPPPTLLMTLAIKARFLHEIEIGVPITDFHKFCLIIDRKFLDTNNNDRFRVYRNVNRLFIMRLEDKIDIIYTNDIYKLCFVPRSLSLPQFKTVNEMLVYMKSINELI